MPECKTPGCDRDASIRGFCKRCYSWTRYWANKPMQQFRKRMEQIDFWSVRGHAKLDNLSSPTRRKRK